MKKTFSFVLALALVFTMCIGMFSTQAQAADGDTTDLQIQVTDKSEEKTTLEGYEYTAYQIFAGDYAEDGTLSNITWGSDIIVGNITDSVVASLRELFKGYVDTTDDNIWNATYLQSSDGAKLVAEALSNIASNSADAKTFATIMSACISGGASGTSDETGLATIYGLADGYYLVETTDVPDGDSAYSDYILVTVGGGDTVGPIEDKEDVTHSDKTVDDVNDSDLSDGGANLKDGKSADYDIGDMVPFTLKGYVSSNYADFAATGIPYETTFHDVMTDGLTFDSESVVVYIVHGTTETEISSDYYTIVTSDLDDNCTFELTVSDFNAVLAAYGITDFDASTDYIKVTFTAELNESALIGNDKKTDSTADGYYGDGTYGNMNKSWIDFSNDAHNADHKGTTAEVEVQVFTYTIIVNKYGDTTEVPLDGAEFTLEKLIDDGGSDSFLGYEGTWTDWDKLEVDNSADGTVFTWKGIDDGVYRISETTTPDGYNTAEDIYLVVTANHTSVDGGGYVTTLTVTTYDKDGNVISATDGAFEIEGDSGEASGTITGDVLNLSGSVLPSTGGIGTTIFYIVGAGIVLCAVVVLVTRRRMRRAA